MDESISIWHLCRDKKFSPPTGVRFDFRGNLCNFAPMNPVIKTIHLELPLPAVGDNRSHEARLRDALSEILNERPFIPLGLMRKLPALLRDSEYRVNAVLVYGSKGWEVADVCPDKRDLKACVIAIDLGSTSVIFYLVDPDTGALLQTISRENPQREYGEDILDRILFAGRGNGLDILREKTLALINGVIREITAIQGVDPEDIFYLAVAGNTTMCHFLMGLDPSNICREPYIPAASSFDIMRAAEIGIKCHEEAKLYCFPNVGAYFGGDLLSGILFTDINRNDAISMFVDVGTNAEVLLGNRDWMVACAGAAGPALEGGILTCGMMAAPGAVERVEFNSKTGGLDFSTIGGLPAAGLCGSGIIDLLASMFRAGVVDQTGKLNPQAEGVRTIDGEQAFVLADERHARDGEPVYITQSDIKNLIRSKGAMYTILNVVVQSVGISFDDIERFYVAGAFGNYIDAQKAIFIGMLPDIPVERFKGVGNAAGEGAIKLLMNRECIKEVEEICDKITYLEMNVRGDFMNQLTASLFLPHTDMKRFPSVRAELSGRL